MVCILEITHALFLQRLEWLTYDSRVKLAHRYPGEFSNNATNLGLVQMSDASIAAVNSGRFGFQYGLYWPRQVYGRALEELALQGAKAVAFDILFAEERPDQPPYLPTNGGSQIPSDQFFADQIAKSGNIILAAERKCFARKFV